jgi:CheY-like chemotaxis protein
MQRLQTRPEESITGASEHGVGARTVLVVDDQPDIRLLLRFLLGRETWAVEEVACGEDAIRRCRTEPFAAVVLDQRMPTMTGTEVARRLRADGVEVPIVLFSASLDESVRRDAADIGIPAVAKGDLVTLVETLRHWCAAA